MTFDYHVVDVFADTAFAGNPLAVVLDADELSTDAMQAMAREFNLSETTFPVRTTTSGADYRLRIFTPTTELPFAGHPSVGTAWLMRHLGRVTGPRVVQECGAGLLPLDVDDEGASLTGGEASYGEPLDAGPLLSAVGLSDADLDPVGPPRTAAAGLTFTYLPVHDAAVARAVPDLAVLSRLEHTGIYVFSYGSAASTAHVRMFADGVGVGEDPATGSAALGLGVWLAVSGAVPGDATTSYTVRQGAEIHRPSRMDCTVTTESGAVVRTTVSGAVRPVAQGRITRP